MLYPLARDDDGSLDEGVAEIDDRVVAVGHDVYALGMTHSIEEVGMSFKKVILLRQEQIDFAKHLVDFAVAQNSRKAVGSGREDFWYDGCGGSRSARSRLSGIAGRREKWSISLLCKE